MVHVDFGGPYYEEHMSSLSFVLNICYTFNLLGVDFTSQFNLEVRVNVSFLCLVLFTRSFATFMCYIHLEKTPGNIFFLDKLSLFLYIVNRMFWQLAITF